MRVPALVLLLAPACAAPEPSTPAAGPTAVATVAAPTWSADVAAIVHANCTVCHRDGGPAPFALVSYDDVRDHAAQVAEVTARGTMPPWLPSPGRGEFVGARRLGDDVRATLARWVEQGAPAGDLARAPAPPSFPDGWQLGAPDLVLDTGVAYELPADGGDVYRNFVIPVPPGPLRFVRAVEIVPDDAKVVHHGVLRVDLVGSVRELDAADPAPGFDGMVFAGAGMPDGRFLGYTPGKRPDPGEDARAWRLHGGSDLVLQLHLRPTGKVEPVRARVGLYFAARAPTRPSRAMELSSSDIVLPPGAKDVHVRDAYRLPRDVRVVSVYPHAHYLGKRVEAWAELPDGARRELILIEDWDFDWQDQYTYASPLQLPRGATIRMDWSFDNSADNPHGRFSPPREVRYGPASTDEMAELILELEPVDPRDLEALDQDLRRKWMTNQADTLARALGRDPGDVAAAVGLGALRQRLGDTPAAVAAYEQALRRDPDHVQALLELGIVWMSAGELPRALVHLRRAAAAAPDQARPQLVLGDALRRQGDPAAVVHYRRCSELDPTLVECPNNLGIVLEGQGDLVGAAEAFARAQALDPRPLFASNLARVRAKLGR
jgi:Flp pilus assembly protein TadD